MSARGTEFEAAVAAGFAHYQRAGRADVKKQHTPQQHGGGYVGQAPIDFRGVVAPAIPFACECKEVASGVSFPLDEDHLPEHERLALDRNVLLGAATYLVVDVVRERAAFRVDWREVQRFIAAPWRASLSLAWLQAFGEVCKETDRDNPKKRAVWVLDVSPHPLRETAYLACIEEKARAGGKFVELFPVERQRKGPSKSQVTFRDLMARKPPRSAPELEHIRWRNEFSEWELERDIREAHRVAARTRKRGWGAR